MAIKKLPPFLYNQIAAGEVVERPASVVKELLENAKDAKASHISLEIQQAGKALILVKDDGVGISHEDIPLSIEAHATSKIFTQEDLEAIKTLGFRGEALASIASVSKFKLASKTKDQEYGYSISTNGLQDTPLIKPCAQTQGTIVEVRELFFNTPARRRFLKADRTELMHIKDIFIRQALINDDIDYTFINDKKTVISVKACHDEQSRQYRIAKLLSKDFTEHTLKVESEFKSLHIKGFILEPTSVEQAIADNVFIFLNSRAIADRVVMHAIKSAYARANFDKSSIRAVLSLTVDPHDIDINVHPRKDEVRFHNSNEVHHIIETSIYEALSRYSKTANLSLDDLDDSDDELDTNEIKQAQEQSVIVKANTVSSRALGKIDYSQFDDDTSESVIKFNVFTPNKETQLDQSLARQNNFYTKLDKENKLQQAIDNSSTKGTFSNSSIKGIISSPQTLSASKLNNFKTLSLLSKINANCLLVLYDCKHYLVQIVNLYQYHLAFMYQQGFLVNQVTRTHLKLPISVKLDKDLYQALQAKHTLLQRLGFDHEFVGKNILLHSYPDILSIEQLSLKLIEALKFLVKQNKSEQNIGLDDFATLCANETKVFDTKDKILDLLVQIQKDNIFLHIHKGVKFLDLDKIADEAFNDSN